MIILTGLLYQFPRVYYANRFFDNILDFIGLSVMLKGVYIRMAARGHKKAHSNQGEGLVTTGLYSYTRNPMYLGTFLVGAGFVLIVWPWWSLPIFGWLFYLRFKKQVLKEEKHLRGLFKEEYKIYCRKVGIHEIGVNEGNCLHDFPRRVLFVQTGIFFDVFI